MSDAPLESRRCVPCEGGVPPLGEREAAELLRQLPEGWHLEDAGDHPQLVKEYRFRNFVEAVDFVNRLTAVAEAEGHHPDLMVAWGRVRAMLWTHAAGGLTENDFILAAKIDRVASAS